MARRNDRDGGGHPIFWLLLGFLCGIVGTLGALLLMSSEVTGDGDTLATTPEASAPAVLPPLEGAPPPGGPVVLTPPPAPIEPRRPIEAVPQPQAIPSLPSPPASPPAARPPLAPRRPAPAVRPTPAPTARPAPAPGRNNADQMAEDAAASGMTARTR